MPYHIAQRVKQKHFTCLLFCAFDKGPGAQNYKRIEPGIQTLFERTPRHTIHASNWNGVASGNAKLSLTIPIPITVTIPFLIEHHRKHRNPVEDREPRRLGVQIPVESGHLEPGRTHACQQVSFARIGGEETERRTIRPSPSAVSSEESFASGCQRQSRFLSNRYGIAKSAYLAGACELVLAGAQPRGAAAVVGAEASRSPAAARASRRRLEASLAPSLRRYRGAPRGCRVPANGCLQHPRKATPDFAIISF